MHRHSKVSLAVGSTILVAVAIATTVVTASSAVAATHKSGVKPAATPKTDVVGLGLVNCAAATGEVGYSPASISGGTSAMMISIWFDATKCSAASTTTPTKPVPKTVIGSMSFLSAQGNTCPLLGSLGEGTLNLTYNYPPVPNPMIDPSVAQNVSVTQSGPFWTLTGQVTWG